MQDLKSEEYGSESGQLRSGGIFARKTIISAEQMEFVDRIELCTKQRCDYQVAE